MINLLNYYGFVLLYLFVMLCQMNDVLSNICPYIYDYEDLY